jgi:hypothetical protein
MNRRLAGPVEQRPRFETHESDYVIKPNAALIERIEGVLERRRERLTLERIGRGSAMVRALAA